MPAVSSSICPPLASGSRTVAAPCRSPRRLASSPSSWVRRRSSGAADRPFSRSRSRELELLATDQDLHGQGHQRAVPRAAADLGGGQGLPRRPRRAHRSRARTVRGRAGARGRDSRRAEARPLSSVATDGRRGPRRAAHEDVVEPPAQQARDDLCVPRVRHVVHVPHGVPESAQDVPDVPVELVEETEILQRRERGVQVRRRAESRALESMRARRLDDACHVQHRGLRGARNVDGLEALYVAPERERAPRELAHLGPQSIRKAHGLTPVPFAGPPGWRRVAARPRARRAVPSETSPASRPRGVPTPEVDRAAARPAAWEPPSGCAGRSRRRPSPAGAVGAQPRQPLEQHDAQGVDVGTSVDPLGHSLLRRHVRQRADQRVAPQDLGIRRAGRPRPCRSGPAARSVASSRSPA